MKKMNWLYLVIVIALVVSCNGKKDDNPPVTDSPKVDQGALVVDSTRTVISLAQLVLDTLIDGPTLLEETKSGNLKKLWGYDKQLYLASGKTKKFIVTTEINPCCPCSTTDPMCCQCLIDTDFAAVSDMGASAKLDNNSIQVASTIDGVDLFTIPSGTTGTHALKIKGRSTPEVTYTIDVHDGTISFN